MSEKIHLAITVDGILRPVCGADDEGCWVTERRAVTCEKCLRAKVPAA